MRTKSKAKPRPKKPSVDDAEPLQSYSSVTMHHEQSFGSNTTYYSNFQKRECVRQYRKAAILRWKQKRLKQHTVRTAIRPKGKTPTSGRNMLMLISDGPSILPDVLSCQHCGAKKFLHETANFCCSNGDIKLASSKLPTSLKELLISKSENGKNFRTLIRTYNNHLGFTSFGVKSDPTLARRNKGIYTFRAQGQVYHFINDLIASEGMPKNLELYFYDTDYEIENRLKDCPRLSGDILQHLLNTLLENPYSKFFRSLSKIKDIDECTIVLRANPKVDQRVYNTPTVSQVSALCLDEEECRNVANRDIKIFTHSGQSRTIQYYYGCYDPLQYPLIFPYGDPGWHEGIPKTGVKVRLNKRKLDLISTSDLVHPDNATSPDDLLRTEEEVMTGKIDKPDFVSVREYYAYKLQIRENDASFILHFGRLFQQYVVDMFIKLETQRLDFFRSQKDDYRQEFLQGIADAVGGGETDSSNIGKRIILPANFIGGPRNMRRRYVDAMTLVQKFGKPDIFLTITCNPNWPEIKNNLRYGQQVQDRPDLVVRVFHAKLQELKIELFKRKIFGEVAAYTYVIEFQKRGLPHAHFLLILKKIYKLYSPDEYDNIVSAEIPDESIHPHLYKMVTKHMMHGPCGILNPSNVCMSKNGNCKNSYPKEFCEETAQSNDAYPKYMRRNDGKKVEVRGKWLDNRWVVPYNPYLLAKFDCHINIEICSTIKAVKYIYKYICKGSDKILFHLASDKTGNTFDEITQFVSARWVCATEALWRLFRFTMGEIKPPVIHLPLHLPNFQPIMFSKKDKLNSVLTNPFLRKTMLTEFFFMNRVNEDAKEINTTYANFSDYFVWQADKKQWKLRQKGHSVGRIVTAHPTEGERYYLRLLLSKIRCPTSYEYLKTYNEVVAKTYHESALLHGFLKDDDSQFLCLEEASVFNMPYELRRLFATLLVYSCPNEPKTLWLRFEQFMSEDFSRLPDITATHVRVKVLEQINGFLQSMGKDLSMYNIVPDSFDLNEIEDLTREIKAEQNIVVSPLDLAAKYMLNEKQKQIYDVIIEKIYSNTSASYFIDGPGGTGKTFLYRALLADVRSKGYFALATATSGIAASILPGGRTAHSRFKIPIDITDTSTCTVSKQGGLALLIRQAKLIIWDEAPMAKKTSLEALDTLLKDLMDTDTIFGGKIVILGGDFRQTLPVVKKGTKSETIKACLTNSRLWPLLHKLQLTENMRARTDPSFTNFLLDIGNGVGHEQDTKNVTIPKSILLHSTDEKISNLENLIQVVYPNIEDQNKVNTSIVNRAILTTKNQFVDQINDILITKFPGLPIEYISYDETVNANDQCQYEDLLNSLTPNGLPPHRLILKKNSPIILLRNLDPTEGLCNGTRLICKALKKNVIHAEIAIGDFAGKQVFIHRIPLQPPSNDTYPVPYKRVQFPIRLCFAMTINKAQGQTLDYVGVYLKEPVFSHGQLYVALSRARNSASVKVLINKSADMNIETNKTKNVVYKEVLPAYDV